MSTRIISFAEHEFYHIYNRGTDKRVIYQAHTDYQRFIELLFLCNNEKAINFREVKKNHKNVFEYERGNQLVSIGAYCLMPNHFHLLMTPLVEQGVSRFMGKITTGYSMYFNKKYDRTGALFEGAFKAKHSDSDEYLKYLFSYIHLNPSKLYNSEPNNQFTYSEELYDKIAKYEYSSLISYIEKEHFNNKIINPEFFPDYFLIPGDMKEELLSWIHWNTESP